MGTFRRELIYGYFFNDEISENRIYLWRPTGYRYLSFHYLVNLVSILIMHDIHLLFKIVNHHTKSIFKAYFAYFNVLTFSTVYI